MRRCLQAVGRRGGIGSPLPSQLGWPTAAAPVTPSPRFSWSTNERWLPRQLLGFRARWTCSAPACWRRHRPAAKLALISEESQASRRPTSFGISIFPERTSRLGAEPVDLPKSSASVGARLAQRSLRLASGPDSPGCNRRHSATRHLVPAVWLNRGSSCSDRQEADGPKSAVVC